MRAQQKFRNVFSYAAGVETWCKNAFAMNGGTLNYTFCNDFAIADWAGVESVKETYERVKKEWGSDYKAFTEVAISLNLLAWANNQLTQQGIEGREPFTALYSTLYYQAREDFYSSFTDNEEAQDYFFSMTD